MSQKQCEDREPGTETGYEWGTPYFYAIRERGSQGLLNQVCLGVAAACRTSLMLLLLL